MKHGLEGERRWPGLVAMAMALCVLVGACTGGGRYQARPGTGTEPASPRPASPAGETVLESSVVPWRLLAPLSRAVALPDGGGALLLGGLRRSQATSDQILHVDLARGTASPAGRLAAPVHDAAAAMLVIDPATRRIVWQYGRTDLAGTAPGLLDTPDGFDLLLAGGATPTHPQTG